MSIATCIVPASALRGELATLSGETFHHLFRVRRLSSGAELRLVDGLGSARWGQVERIGADEAVVRLGGRAASNEASLRLELWVAPARPQRSTWLVEKATEIGVSAIRWLDSERVARRITEQRIERLRRVAAAAVEQCHRSRIPEVTGSHSWEETIDVLRAVTPVWFLDTASGVGLGRCTGEGVAALLIGPEGGWNEVERNELIEAGAIGAGLGPRHLRLETAAVAGAAILLCGTLD